MDDRPIRIGSMVPLTGISASDGREFLNGLNMAISEINGRGGILGRKLEAIFLDTGSQTAEAVVKAARTLITQHRVNAIINGYNIGPQNSEYEAIADAGIIYIHNNTLLQHHDTVSSDPKRYFGCFMGDPAEYWYGQGFVKFISWLRDTGQWKPRNRRLVVISGPKPYSVVIANAMGACSRQFGWESALRPRIVHSLGRDLNNLFEEIRALDPAVLAFTHFFSGDLAKIHLQFMKRPLPVLLYLQYGALHRSFADIVGQQGRGAVVGTVIGLLRDECGRRFSERYKARFGPQTTPEIGCQPYVAMHHYAIAAAVAGSVGDPGDFDSNRRIADALLRIPYRSVAGIIRYHHKWQAAIPYPDETSDPSMGLPHLFYQLRDPDDPPALIAPEPYADADFELPPWLKEG